MARPRKRGNKDLPPGLYRNRAGTFVIRKPGTGEQVSLETKDRNTAFALHSRFYPQLKEKAVEERANRLFYRLEGGAPFTDYARRYREEVLPHAQGRGGKPLAEKTRSGYAEMLRYHIEASQTLNRPLAEIGPTVLRQFLAAWLDAPATYNHLLAVLAKVLQHAVDEGHLERNPARAVDRRPRPKRETYLPDSHYLAIIERLAEWQARACDLIYLLSQRPGDVLGLKDSDWDGEALWFAQSKTDQPMRILANEDLAQTVDWFRDWKRRQGLASPYLICYPRSHRKRGRRVTVDYLSERWRVAAQRAGFKGYQLKDLRPKGLSDEFVEAGDSEKSGHRTEEMKCYYRRRILPMEAASNLRRVRRGTGTDED